MTTMDTCTLQPAIHVLGKLLATVPDSALLVMVETTHPEYSHTWQKDSAYGFWVFT